jgi:hypothetical protein
MNKADDEKDSTNSICLVHVSLDHPASFWA